MEVVSVNHEQMGKAFQGQGRDGEWVGGWWVGLVGLLIVWVHYSGWSIWRTIPKGGQHQSHFLFSLFHDCNVFQLILLFVILTEHFLSVIVVFQ